MKEIEIALKNGQKEPVIGSVLVENIESIEQVEDAIKARDRFMESGGGRPNKVEQIVDEITRHLEKDNRGTALHVFQRRKKELSSTSVWRVKQSLEDKGFKIQSFENENGDA